MCPLRLRFFPNSVPLRPQHLRPRVLPPAVPPRPGVLPGRLLRLVQGTNDSFGEYKPLELQGNIKNLWCHHFEPGLCGVPGVCRVWGEKLTEARNPEIWLHVGSCTGRPRRFCSLGSRAPQQRVRQCSPDPYACRGSSLGEDTTSVKHNRAQPDAASCACANTVCCCCRLELGM